MKTFDKTFDSGGPCPICGRTFKSDSCPHSIVDASDAFNAHKLRKQIRRMVKQELKNETPDKAASGEK